MPTKERLDSAQYPCPHGCERNGKPIPITSVQGWKKHMTMKHGTWTDEQLATALGQPPIESNDEFSRMAESMPETESGVSASTPGEAATGAATGATGTRNEPAPSTTVRTDAASKKLNSKMEKMKREIAKEFPKAIGAFLSDKGPEWALDESQKNMLADSVESVFDMLDIQFSIQQFNVELKSRLWVFLYPVAVFCMIMGVKAVKNAPKEKQSEETTTIN